MFLLHIFTQEDVCLLVLESDESNGSNPHGPSMETPREKPKTRLNL